MRRFNLWERWRARTYTPLVLVPHVWALLIVLYILTGFNACGFTVMEGNLPTGEVHVAADNRLDGTDALIFWATMIAGSAIAFARRRTRRGGLRARGWTVHAPGVRAFDGRFSTFPFGYISRLKLTQLATGTHRGSYCASFSVWPRPQLIRRFYDVDLVELPLVLPPLALFPQRQYDKVAAALGGDDILTESDSFNRRWRVVGRDTRYGLAVLHPLMMELLDDPSFDRMAITIDGGTILTWQPGRSKISSLGDRLDSLRTVAQMIPRNVWDDFGTPRDPKWGAPGAVDGSLVPGVTATVPPVKERLGWDFGIRVSDAPVVVPTAMDQSAAREAESRQTFFPEPWPPAGP